MRGLANSVENFAIDHPPDPERLACLDHPAAANVDAENESAMLVDGEHGRSGMTGPRPTRVTEESGLEVHANGFRRPERTGSFGAEKAKR